MNGLHKNRMKWFVEKISPRIENKYEFKYVSEENGDLGDLEGVQFDNPTCGGYIYFWSSGYVGYEIFSYELDKEIITDTTVDISSAKSLENELEKFITAI